MMHTLTHAILRELPHGELTSMIGVERHQLHAELAFHSRLDLLDSSRCTILRGDHDNPHVPVEVIHEQQEVLITPLRHWCDWTA
jgi:hypothetical protein